jgi:hypothetical protein
MKSQCWRQQHLHATIDPKDNSGYLKVILYSMNDHGAWAAPLAIGIEHSMRDTGCFIDPTGGEGMRSSRAKQPRQGGRVRGGGAGPTVQVVPLPPPPCSF